MVSVCVRLFYRTNKTCWLWNALLYKITVCLVSPWSNSCKEWQWLHWTHITELYNSTDVQHLVKLDCGWLVSNVLRWNTACKIGAAVWWIPPQRGVCLKYFKVWQSALREPKGMRNLTFSSCSVQSHCLNSKPKSFFHFCQQSKSPSDPLQSAVSFLSSSQLLSGQIISKEPETRKEVERCCTHRLSLSHENGSVSGS